MKTARSETFIVYALSSAIHQKRLSALCVALAEGALKPASEGVLNNLYAKSKSRIVTHLDELWGSNEPEFPPPYHSSMVLGASDDALIDQSDFGPSNITRAPRKRRISTPVARQTPSKRRPSMEKSVPEPWEVAIAAIRAKLWALREEQQVRCTAVVDPENKLRFPPDQVAYCASPTDYVSHSQTSTVGDTVEDSSMMAEEAIVKEQKQRALSDANADYNEQHVREMMEMLPNSLVREILDAPGVHSLLAAQQQAEQTEIQATQSGSRKVTATEVEQIVKESVDKHVDERLEQKIKVAFKSLVRERVDCLVQDRLPLAADLVLHGATEGYRDQFYEDCKTNEASLLEMVDEGRTQVQDTMNDCIAEINDTIQNQIGKLESWSGELSTSIGEQLARLGYWSDKFARSSASDRYAKKSMSRCKSI
ncbi:hypothetical protein D6D28_03176 [Aureobasidium pullulans]|uniref:Uncharacterized protein n=1 Tax=Aureobasidium pullulans TaxID=5580 RepID=A0A4S8SRA8_AURPU|nr:hypothetical protein D6D28_03176 [Aureobasidium pullulans]